MLKNDLRKSAKEFRKTLGNNEKNIKDKIIFDKVVNSVEYLNSKIVLCYYSTEFEVDTIELIKYSLSLNKRVALPKCVDENGKMVFKYIDSINDLVCGHFGIKEPKNNLVDYQYIDDAICIIPALMVDMNGFRLGYGKGYYDRFLSRFKGFKCVLCYKENLIDELPVFDDFDIKCDLCITD